MQATTCTSPAEYVGSFRVALYMERYDFADGSVLVNCEVQDDTLSITNTRMYMATQQGSTTGTCLVVYDQDTTNSRGFWNLSVLKGAANGAGQYVDAGSPVNGRTKLLTCTTY